jgi:SnoaL-like domain
MDRISDEERRRIAELLAEGADAVHIGTDAGEWWSSGQFVDGVAAAGGGGDIGVVADDIDVHVQGDVAWVEGRGRFMRADGAERPVRVTGVLVREGGQWRLVQSHSSIAVPNTDIFG